MSGAPSSSPDYQTPDIPEGAYQLQDAPPGAIVSKEHLLPHDGQIIDCVVVGGGVAGLTAGIYLARFHRTVLVIDSFKSRACAIPKSYNAPGYVSITAEGKPREGIIGEELLARLRCQCVCHGGLIISDRVVNVERFEDTSPAEVAGRMADGPTSAPSRSSGSGSKEQRLFATSTLGGKLFLSRTIIFATGVVDVMPPVKDARNLVKGGGLKICAVCDAFELGEDEHIALITYGSMGVPEARFLRSYSEAVTYFTVATDAAADDSKFPAALSTGDKQPAQPSGAGNEPASKRTAYTPFLGHGSEDIVEVHNCRQRDPSARKADCCGKGSEERSEKHKEGGNDDKDAEGPHASYNVVKEHAAVFEGKAEISRQTRDDLEAIGVKVVEAPVVDIEFEKEEEDEHVAGRAGDGEKDAGLASSRRRHHAMKITVKTQDGASYSFGAAYTVMGTVSRGAFFGRTLGVSLGEDGRFCEVSSRKELCPEGEGACGIAGGGRPERRYSFGAFAAGDCVDGLNQISVASGDAAIAATSVHKLLTCEGHAVVAGKRSGSASRSSGALDELAEHESRDDANATS